MTVTTRWAAVAVVFVCVLAISSAAQAQEGVYRLTPEAYLQRGCLPPCLCPMMDAVRLRGTFNVAKAPSQEAAWIVYDITEVNWYTKFKGEEIMISGSGMYRISTKTPAHQMTLVLQVGDEEPMKFDSGLVPMKPTPEPMIDILIAMNGFYCYDTVIRVAAVPVPKKEILWYKLVDSKYQQGCWPPCECALWEPVPVVGEFGLVSLDSPWEVTMWNEYAVVNVDWRIGWEWGEMKPIDVDGCGRYIHSRASLKPLQRMTAMLSFEGQEPLWFDSDLVEAKDGIKEIDITITRNKFYCFDQVFYLHAVRAE